MRFVPPCCSIYPLPGNQPAALKLVLRLFSCVVVLHFGLEFWTTWFSEARKEAYMIDIVQCTMSKFSK